MQHLSRNITRLLRRKFIRDTLTLQAGKLVNTGLSLVVWVLTVRLLGMTEYGVWGLLLSFFALWGTLQLTGVGISTTDRLGRAVGANDDGEVLTLLAFYVKVMLGWALLTVVVMLLFAPALAAALYDGDPRIGYMARGFAFTIGADALYTLVVIALQSRRLMRPLTLLQNANQLMLAGCVLAALLIDATPESLVFARLTYSYTTMLLAFAVYTRLRTADGVTFPPLGAVFRRAVTVSPRGYWRSGVLMAFDKNTSSLYTQLPVTLVGVLAGETAAGYLRTGLDAINRAGLLTGAVLTNMQALVPQAVGRGDYIGLHRNFGRVLLGMLLIGVLYYGMLAVAAPVALPLLLGPDAAPAVPVFVTLALYGAITTVGGIFGPLYRALDRLRLVFIIKVVTLLLLLPVGVDAITAAGAAGGAWLIVGFYGVSVGLTVLVMLPILRRRAHVPLVQTTG